MIADFRHSLQRGNSSGRLTRMLVMDIRMPISLTKLITMRFQNIHQDFKRQFRPECLAFTCRQEQAYNNMLYRQYKGTERKLRSWVRGLKVEPAT